MSVSNQYLFKLLLETADQKMGSISSQIYGSHFHMNLSGTERKEQLTGRVAALKLY